MPQVGTKQIAEYDDKATEALMSASVFVPITDGVDFPEGECRAIWCGTAGTATVRQPNATDRANFPLKEGFNPIRAIRVTLGTAADVWALY